MQGDAGSGGTSSGDGVEAVGGCALPDLGLSQRELAERMGTTQSVISRLDEDGGAKNRIDTLARVAEALGWHLIVSFPQKVPAKLKDAVQVA